LAVILEENSSKEEDPMANFTLAGIAGITFRTLP